MCVYESVWFGNVINTTAECSEKYSAYKEDITTQQSLLTHTPVIIISYNQNQFSIQTVHPVLVMFTGLPTLGPVWGYASWPQVFADEIVPTGWQTERVNQRTLWDDSGHECESEEDSWEGEAGRSVWQLRQIFSSAPKRTADICDYVLSLSVTVLTSLPTCQEEYIWMNELDTKMPGSTRNLAVRFWAALVSLTIRYLLHTCHISWSWLVTWFVLQSELSHPSLKFCVKPFLCIWNC